jgi:hypothetical protein
MRRSELSKLIIEDSVECVPGFQVSALSSVE